MLEGRTQANPHNLPGPEALCRLVMERNIAGHKYLGGTTGKQLRSGSSDGRLELPPTPVCRSYTESLNEQITSTIPIRLEPLQGRDRFNK
jgi:hypothetical protein